jgi:hypothetical protein
MRADARHDTRERARPRYSLGAGQDLGIEPVFLAEVLAMEAAAVDLVDCVELLPWVGLERGKGTDSLRSQGAAVHEEQHAPADARLHQAINLVNERECLAGACRHSNQHVPLALSDRALEGSFASRW